MGNTSSRQYQIPDLVPAPRNNNGSLIDNLILGLSKHLKKLAKDRSRTLRFLETRWIPTRKITLRELVKLADTHKEQNIVLRSVHLSSKSISATGKLAAIAGSAFPPVAAVALVISLGADVVSEGVSIQKAKNKNKTLKEAEEALNADREVTEKLRDVLCEYRLLLKDVKDTVDEFHKATKDGLFDQIKMSPPIAKFLNKVRSVDREDPNSTREILNALKELLSNAEIYSETWMNFVNFIKVNPEVKECLFQGVEVFSSALSTSLLLSTSAKSVGKAIFFGLNFIFFVKDVKDIGEIISSPKDGTDQVTYKIKKVLDDLKKELEYMEEAVSSLVKPRNQAM